MKSEKKRQKLSNYVTHINSAANCDHIQQYPMLLHDRGADKPLARPGRKQATATEDFDVHISYL